MGLRSIGGAFKKVGRGLKTGGKVAWKVYNSGPGQVLVTAFAPAKITQIVAASVMAVNGVKDQMEEDESRALARKMALQEFPQAADDKKLLNFLIEAQLQRLAGNADID